VKKTGTKDRSRLRPGSRSAKARRRSLPEDRTAIPHKPGLHVLLGKTIEFLLSAGESPEQIARELESHAERVKNRTRICRTIDAKHVQAVHERFSEICGVVHDWHREPAYTNLDGDPLHLTRGSLRTLVGKRIPRREVSATIRRMLECGVIRKTTRGRIALVGGRTVIFRKEAQRAALVDYAASVVPQYLRTSLRNAATQNLYFRDVNRAARIFFLPKKYVPLWREVVRERARAFLEGVDNWLEDHARRNDPGPVCEVAVHCYAYTGDSRLPGPAGTNISRLKVGG
jgi:hypothetical protein